MIDESCIVTINATEYVFPQQCNYWMAFAIGLLVGIWICLTVFSIWYHRQHLPDNDDL